jgi:putative ABC transport system substrate-binding protein
MVEWKPAFEGQPVRRRDFITLVGGTAAAWPLTARTQKLDVVRRIGVLMGLVESDPEGQTFVAAFQEGLQKLGWAEGHHIRIDYRWGAGDADRTRSVARELVDLRPDVILSHTTFATGALARETRTIPIVFVNVGDPIASGFAASLARPGGIDVGYCRLGPAR